MSSAMSLKARIRNVARQKNIPAQVVLQNYMFERLLVRLSLSIYRDRFVLKGGILVAALVGLDNRVTMDLDTTLKNLPMTPDSIRTALEEICAISCEDDIIFAVGNITPIREDDVYGGYRVMLSAHYDTIRVSLSVDVSTGDVITPRAVEYIGNLTAQKGVFRAWTCCVYSRKCEALFASKITRRALPMHFGNTADADLFGNQFYTFQRTSGNLFRYTHFLFRAFKVTPKKQIQKPEIEKEKKGLPSVTRTQAGRRSPASGRCETLPLFQRASKHCSVMFPAHSDQTKGRIERLLNAFQSRLPVEFVSR
ncbi:MAG: nucleotidyl transferase AbiEii/AbiGii toxin family protein [Oscillospiraceae bacterium]|nr:nucleotidyl transferase AbiEii/AbiGii toxin family protein [Oscillospiraceae bacterium]